MSIFTEEHYFFYKLFILHYGTQLHRYTKIFECEFEKQDRDLKFFTKYSKNDRINCEYNRLWRPETKTEIDGTAFRLMNVTAASKEIHYPIIIMKNL